MTRTERMAYLMRELLGVRHDWARVYGENGRDTVTRELDVALAGMEVEIQYAEAKETQNEIR